MAKKLDVPQTGKVGTMVNVKTRYGQIQRQCRPSGLGVIQDEEIGAALQGQD